MKELLLVGAGGFLGSVARYLVADAVGRAASHGRFPLGTFAVNLAGCLAAGILAGLVVRNGYFSLQTRLFLFTGLLGGFTTFSAFGLETMSLLRRGDWLVAGAYAIGSLVLGLAAVWIGFRIAGPAAPG